MIFDEKLVKEVTKGALFITNTDGWFSFERLLPEQAKAFAVERNYTLQVPCTAGVSLCFRTDAREFSFDYRVTGAVSRFFFAFDLLIDGGKYATFGKEVGEDEGKCLFTLPAGDKEVELYLPCIEITKLKNITVDGSITPVPRLPRMLFLGDSITQGYDSHTPFGCYTAIVSRKMGYEQLNQAISGAVFMPDTIAPLPDRKPDCIVVSFGTNDWKHGSSGLRGRVEAYFAKLHLLFGDTPIFAITPLWRADNQPPTVCGTLIDVMQLIEEVCARYPNIRTVDGFSIVPHDRNLFRDHRLHPNELGYAYYADGVIKAMQTTVPVRRIRGASMAYDISRTREASRGIVLQDGKLLISHDIQMDMVMTPGGGKEQGETNEECCAREIEEETGLVVRVGKEALIVEEFYEDVRYITHYFLCELVGVGTKHLTALEEAHGLVPEWASPEEFLRVVARHADFAESCEEKRGLYLREYTAAVRIL